MTTVRKAVIPAAGLGTRMLPATKVVPKEMVPIVDRPAIQYSVEEAAACGIDDICVVTARGKETMQDHFDRATDLEEALEKKGRHAELAELRRLCDLAQLHYVRQHEPRGLGHAVSVARRHVGAEPFAVLLPDDILEGPGGLRAMIDAFSERGGSVIALLRVPLEEISALGSIRPEPLGGGLYRVQEIVEKPAPEEAPSDLAVVGRYVFTPGIFEALEQTPPGAGGEIQLTDAIALLNQSEPVYGMELPVRRFDVGKKLDYLKTTVEVGLTHPALGEPFREFLADLARREGWVGS